MAKKNKNFYKDTNFTDNKQSDVDSIAASFSDHAFRQPIDPRRRPEINDSRMIREDHTKMSNLSETAIHKQWNPGKFQPHYWMESEVIPFDAFRFNEPGEI